MAVYVILLVYIFFSFFFFWVELLYTDSVKEFYIIIQSNAYICKTFKIVDDWVKHFYWYGNTWLDICVKIFYTDSTYKLNPYFFT